MRSHSSYINRRKEGASRPLWHVLFSYCLVGFVSVTIVFGQSSRLSFEPTTKKGNAYSEEQKKSSYPLDNPFQSDTSSNESKIPDGKELEDAEDDDSYKNISVTALGDLFDSNCFKCCFLQLQRSFQNRTTVCLFVLHHAWKSSILDF